MPPFRARRSDLTSSRSGARGVAQVGQVRLTSPDTTPTRGLEGLSPRDGGGPPQWRSSFRRAYPSFDRVSDGRNELARVERFLDVVDAQRLRDLGQVEACREEDGDDRTKIGVPGELVEVTPQVQSWHANILHEDVGPQASLAEHEPRGLIVGLDAQADGGTHVRHTREVGTVVVVGKAENKGKGHRRIGFACR